MDPQEVKVLVPADRVTEFYRWFADWRDGSPAASLARPAAAEQAPTDGATKSEEERLAAAVKWWRSLKPSERGVWGLWIDAAPRLLTADQIVAQLGLNGPRDIPGILSWVTRKGDKVGFKVGWQFETDSGTGSPMYGLCDVDGLTAIEYAGLLRRAKAIAEA